MKETNKKTIDDNKSAKGKNLGGRPKLDIDEKTVEKLAMMQCTDVEIATFFGCDDSTIKDRFSELIKKGRETGKMSLRRVMYKKAIEEGNITMMIWLSKQYLEMADKQELTGAMAITSWDALEKTIAAEKGKNSAKEKSGT